MTAKRISLSAALHEAAGHQPAPETNVVVPETGANATGKSAARRGLKVVSGHFDPAVSKQLWLLVIERDSSIQALLAEAINDLFIKYRRNPIA